MTGCDRLNRYNAVAQAVDNLRARGVYPSPDVLALYNRYVCGQLSHESVQTLMHNRAENILARRRYYVTPLEEQDTRVNMLMPTIPLITGEVCNPAA